MTVNIFKYRVGYQSYAAFFRPSLGNLADFALSSSTKILKADALENQTFDVTLT